MLQLMKGKNSHQMPKEKIRKNKNKQKKHRKKNKKS